MITGVPNEAEPGNAGSLAVYAEDQFGNVDTNDNATVSFSSSTPGAILPGPLPLVNGELTSTRPFKPSARRR